MMFVFRNCSVEIQTVSLGQKLLSAIIARLPKRDVRFPKTDVRFNHIYVNFPEANVRFPKAEIRSQWVAFALLTLNPKFQYSPNPTPWTP